MKDKIIYYGKVIIYSIILLLAFFSMVIFIFGLIMYFISGFAMELLYGSIGWFIFTLILSFIVNRYKYIWEEYYSKQKTTQEIPFKSDDAIRVIFYVVSFILLYRYFQGFLGPFPDNLTKDVAIEILKLISQINGILIGFLGVAISQIYKNNREKINSYAVFTSFVSFMISIFYCITNLTNLGTTNNTQDIINPPLTFLLNGLCVFILFIINFFSRSE